MNKSVSYKSTVMACYLGNITQAIVVNLTPILFIPLKEQFGFTYTQFGLLVLINFISQVIVDIVFSKAVDKHGFRQFAVTAHILCMSGFLLFAAVPTLFKGNEYVGFVLATVLFSSSGGLLELLLSPIVDAIPTKEKDKAMAMLHSFYSWGQVAVVAITTLCIFLNINWQWIVLFWILFPLINTILFAKVPLAQKHTDKKTLKIRELMKAPVFLLACGCIAFGGASELIMSQWASSYLQQGLALPKIAGDILGMCGFAVMMGIGRLIYGIYGDKLNMHKVLITGSLLSAVCYVVVAVSPFKWISIVACVITGLCVSLLWPGTLVIASEKLPLAGASLFALLAAGGDIGASIGPWLTGLITDTSIALNPGWFGLTAEQFGLRTGILLAVLFPILSWIFQMLMLKKSKE